ncbi:MAG: hypothetical protein PVH11_13030, partial [Anaerolineae bacterium]
MNRSQFPIRLAGAVAALLLLALVLSHPINASFLLQSTPEPPPRPTATPSPFLSVSPSQFVGEQNLPMTVSGGQWPGGSGVTLYWDGVGSDRWLAGPVSPDGNGSFSVGVVVPAAWAPPGTHRVIAVNSQGFQTSASVSVIAPTPSNTPTVTNTPPPTNTSPPPLPTTPAPTDTSTPSPTPQPTLRPITPVVTGTPVPPP